MLIWVPTCEFLDPWGSSGHPLDPQHALKAYKTENTLETITVFVDMCGYMLVTLSDLFDILFESFFYDPSGCLFPCRVSVSLSGVCFLVGCLLL